VPTTSAEPTIVRAVVRAREYFDSVFLMRVADRIAHLPGILDAAAVMATEANRARLAGARLATAELERAGADDLVIAIRAVDTQAADAAMADLESLLAPPDMVAKHRPPDLEGAIASLPSANLALISVPGEYAAAEARRALERGLHAFIFSSNVTLEDERSLKHEARTRGLLVMGPDCGTAIIRGVGLGFANVVRRGRIGVVGASGTGMQEITVLVDRGGGGISHALGIGSRDPTDAVGGISMLAALEALAADPGTDVICLVSKPPGAATRLLIDDAVRRSPKPVVTCFPGGGTRTDDARAARTFEQAAAIALGLAAPTISSVADPADMATRLDGARVALAPTQRSLRGLFAGGSLALEAVDVLQEVGIPREEHQIVDLGAERLTEGRPHPMIDPRLRRARLADAARDPSVAAVLFDVILGRGVASDPAGDLAGTIVAARRDAESSGRHLAFVASLIGTPSDPQGLDRQQATLADAGVIVLPTSARAARAAASLIGGPLYE
jgi:FdrA protein